MGLAWKFQQSQSNCPPPPAKLARRHRRCPWRWRSLSVFGISAGGRKLKNIPGASATITAADAYVRHPEERLRRAGGRDVTWEAGYLDGVSARLLVLYEDAGRPLTAWNAMIPADGTRPTARAGHSAVDALYNLE